MNLSATCGARTARRSGAIPTSAAIWWRCAQPKSRRAIRPLLAVLFLASFGHAEAQSVMSVLAAQIRIQGFACDEPQRATRDAKLSKPDYAVWVLTYKNATYRIGRYPGLEARVEKLK